MLVELGNHDAKRAADQWPSVTTIHIPEADEEGLGGYTHTPGGITAAEFQQHVQEAEEFNDGIYHIPGHEVELILRNAWRAQARGRPHWIHVVEHELTPAGHADSLTAFLQDFYATDKEKPGNVEDMYHTFAGPPGVGGRPLPPLEATFTNAGRVQQAINDGGGKAGDDGTGTAASATTLTTNKTYITDEWKGYRVVCMGATKIVWANIISNTNAAGASVLTVDRWYNGATSGGAAATTPASGFQYLILDGGNVSAWFIALTTTNITPAATDNSMTGEYTTAGGGFVRKIAPYSLTSGTSPMTFTLAPVFTGNGSDTYPSTFYAIGAFNSMVVSNTAAAMKFETTMSASATVAQSGDQITVTETVTGS